MPENIKIKNSYFEQVNTLAFEGLIKKNAFDSVKPRYWLSKALDRAIKEAGHYHKNKKDLVRKHTIKYEKDGARKDKEGQVVQKWKRGDPVILPNGTMPFESGEAFSRELDELQEIEVDLGIQRIKFDEPPDVTIEENMLLFPFLEEKEKFEEKKRDSEKK